MAVLGVAGAGSGGRRRHGHLAVAQRATAGRQRVHLHHLLRVRRRSASCRWPVRCCGRRPRSRRPASWPAVGRPSARGHCGIGTGSRPTVHRRTATVRRTEDDTARLMGVIGPVRCLASLLHSDDGIWRRDAHATRRSHGRSARRAGAPPAPVEWETVQDSAEFAQAPTCAALVRLPGDHRLPGLVLHLRAVRGLRPRLHEHPGVRPHHRRAALRCAAVRLDLPDRALVRPLCGPEVRPAGRQAPRPDRRESAA